MHLKQRNKSCLTPVLPCATGFTRDAEYTEKGKFSRDQNSETSEFRPHSSAFSAGERVFNSPQGELFEQNSDFSNSAQGYVVPLCDLCASSAAGGEIMVCPQRFLS